MQLICGARSVFESRRLPVAKWLGIDITASCVRVALLKTGYRRTSLVALREERLSDHDTTSAALRAASVGLKADACATAVDGARSFLRRLALPAAAQKELANVLSYEVEATLPFELDDAVMDHRRLRHVEGLDEPKTLPILAGVAYTEEVRDRIGLARRGVGQEPLRVGLGALPLANLAQLAPELRQPSAVALLDIGEQHADVVVLHGGEPRFGRSLSRGVAGLPTHASMLARELRQTLAAWRSEGGAKLQELIVVGSGRSTPGIESFLRDELDIRVRDLPKLALDELNAGQEVQLARYAKAIGLALGLSRSGADLNLRQGPLETQQSYQFLRDKTPLLAGLFAAILVSFGFSVFAEMRALRSERASLEEQLAVSTKAHFGKETRNPKLVDEWLDAAVAGKTGDPMPKVDAWDVLLQTGKIPNTIVHDIADLDFNRGDLTIKGVVPSIDDAHAVAKIFKEHKCFKEVNISRTTKLKRDNRQKYTLDLKARCSAAKKKTKKGAKKKSPKKGAKSTKGKSR